MDGTVSRITKFEAFINLAELTGCYILESLLGIGLKKLKIYYTYRSSNKVQVLKVDKAGEKISLSMKNLSLHPWDSVSERLPLGLITKGK
ncbi:hypothetical protein AGMMS49921_05710 [Endomicrobiia bacterium]|nr:hypothetical protein AGMMS49921_05710 [Endomicrobiia bacterium]